MKRYFSALIMLLCIGVACAQERNIRMPNVSTIGNNIAERNKGYWCAIELGGGSTVMENRKNIALVGTNFTNGYRFNQYAKVGAGIGLLYYPNNSNVRDTDAHLSFPIYLHARGNILSEEIRHIVPYWSANLGTSISDGMFFTPGVGLRIGEKRSAFIVNINYTIRHLNAKPKLTKNYSGILVKIGYEY